MSGFEACARCRGSGAKRARHGAREGAPCKWCGGRGVVQADGAVEADGAMEADGEEPAPSPEDVHGAASLSRKRPRAAFSPAFAPLVVVVGGGLGGCALALGLQQRNIPCVVLERDASFEQRAQGYGLTMQQAATTLRRLGFLDLRSLGVAPESHASYLPDGTLLGNYGRCVHSTTRAAGGTRRGEDQRFNIQLPRQALRRMLLDALRPGTVRWGCHFDSYELVRPGDVVVRFSVRCAQHQLGQHAQEQGPPPPQGTQSQSSLRAGLLVGADGIWSRVRRQLLGPEDSPLRYLGLIVVLGRAPCEHPLARDKVFQTLGGETRLYAMPFVPGVTMWQLSFPLPLEQARALSAAGPAALLAEAISRCGDWHAPIDDLLRNTSAQDVTGYPAYDRPPPLPPHVTTTTTSSLSSPSTTTTTTAVADTDPSVVLIGDAAHPMSPFKGQGANQAIIDGWTLARELGAGTALEGPVHAFLREMARRVTPKVDKSAEAAAVLHTEQGVCARSSKGKT
jgi:salicylate hydroxylase